MPDQVLLARLLDLVLPHLFFPQRLLCVIKRRSLNHGVSGCVFKGRRLDHARDSVRSQLHLQISYLLFLQLLLIVVPKGVDGGRARAQLLLLVHVLVLLALHLGLVAVLEALAPLIPHVAVSQFLIRERANALLLLLEVHLALEPGQLLALLVVLVELRRHHIVVLLLPLCLVQALPVLLALILAIFGVLHRPLHLIDLLLGHLIALDARKTFLILALTKLIRHHLPLILLHFAMHSVGRFMLGLEDGGPLVIIPVPVLRVILLLLVLGGDVAVLGLHLLLFGVRGVFDTVGARFQCIELIERFAKISKGWIERGFRIYLQVEMPF